MKQKKYKTLLIIAITLFLLSGMMFIAGISMFASRGDFHQIIISLSEFCFIMWMPTFIMETILFILSFTSRK